MARKKELTTVADKLEQLEELQAIHSKIDAIHILKGELPIEVADLEDEIAGTQKRVGKVQVEIDDAQEEIEHRKTLMKEAQTLITKYDKQLTNVKNNREFDALNKDIELQKLEIQLAEKKIREANFTIDNHKNQLEEVVVKFVKPKSKILGRNSKGFGLMHFNFYTYYEKDVDDRLSKEVGMKFKLKKDCKINDLNFNITSNDFKSLKFRLNFYKIENGLPTELISEKDIIFEIKDEYKGWFTLDLKQYDIYLNKDSEDVAISIQWIESKKVNEKSKYFGISTAM